MTNTEDDDEFGAPPPVDKLELAKRVRPLVDRWKKTKVEKAEAEARVKELDQQIKAIEEQQLPALMDEIGLTDFSVLFDDGTRASIEVGDHVHASLPVKDPEKRRRGMAWLRANKGGSIIKRGFTIKFTNSKAELEAAAKFEAFLKTSPVKVNIEDKDDVHHGTLTTFVKDLLKEGRATPEVLEILGAHVTRKAEIS